MIKVLSAIWLLILLITPEVPGQKVIQFEEKKDGQIFLTEDIAIPAENAGYTLILPDKTPVKGLVIFFNAGRDTSDNSFYPFAIQRQLGVMYVTTGNRLEFFFTAEKLAQVDAYIHHALTTNNLSGVKLFLTGMSLAGTRALKFAKYCLLGKSEYGHQPAPAAVCDAPLDFVRFWKTCKRAEKINFHPAAANEGKWVSGYLEHNLGGSPTEQLPAYQDYSPYCYSADNGGNARYFASLPLRAYTEPDVKWWMESRRKDYYDMNAIDAAALVNELNIMGNEKAELIVTKGKGYLPDGRRHPHSWSIVDERELVDWFVANL